MPRQPASTSASASWLPVRSMNLSHCQLTEQRLSSSMHFSLLHRLVRCLAQVDKTPPITPTWGQRCCRGTQAPEAGRWAAPVEALVAGRVAAALAAGLAAAAVP